LSHIIASRHYFRIVFIEGRDLTEKEEAEYMPGLEMGKYISELITDDEVEIYLEKLKSSNKQLIESVSKLSKKEFFEKREGYNPNTGCNLAWILYHLAEDEVNHRGQMSLILKLFKNQNQ